MVALPTVAFFGLRSIAKEVAEVGCWEKMKDKRPKIKDQRPKTKDQRGRLGEGETERRKGITT